MQNWNINPQTLSYIPGSVWVYWKNLDGNYLGCNDLMAKSLNLASSQDIVDKSDLDLGISSNEAELYRSCDLRVIQTGIPLQFNDSATLSHKKIEFNVIKSPLYKNNKLIGIIGLSYYSSKYNTNTVIIDGIMLSPRETQIVRGLIHGKTAKHIACTLGLSPRTVEDYLINIKSKLNVPSKYKLIEKVIASMGLFI